MFSSVVVVAGLPIHGSSRAEPVLRNCHGLSNLVDALEQCKDHKP